ncbi:MAG: hypothetical protein QOJ16_3360 [Acidobacteriota bacterium]|jgi:hypothetical protein|nr:hypothetical protein [Acidobacteriota bacterium]
MRERTRRGIPLACTVLLLQLLALAGSVPPELAADDDAPPAPGPGKVTLALRDYLTLVEKVETLDRERARESAQREAPLAEVVVERLTVVIGDPGRTGAGGGTEAELTAHYEALIQGHPKAPLLLPFRGLAARAEVQPASGAAISAASGGEGLLFVAPAAGRYAVEVHGRAALADQGGVRRLAFATVVAAVAEVTVELPADLAWESPGAVVVEEKVAGGRRAVRLAIHRGQSPVFDIQRRLNGTEADRLLAQSVVLTLFQLRPDGLRRHDVVLYEVSRGSLGSLAVDLPADLAVEQVATDEGDVVPVVEAHHLTVHRRRQLQGIGYLVLSSTPSLGASLPASAVLPGIEVRARYLAVASSVAAEVQPTPAASWSRVDLSDLPPALGEALQALDLTAAWRLSAAVPAGPALPALPAATALAVTLLPPSPRLPTLVRRRETTTLLTVDGTVVHRDRFTLDQAGAALDLTLPAGAVLWSAKVGDQPVRPVARKAGSGGLSVPLGFANAGVAGTPPVVEVVSVLERMIPKGRSALALTLPQVAAPVVEHQWRLLLPEGARYRFKSGDLKPAHEPPAEVEIPRPAAVEETITVTAEAPLLDERKIGQDEKRRKKDEAAVTDFDSFQEEAQQLKQGLVGGVKPLAVVIPETGKVLLLVGALPPARISVELEIKGKE